LGGTRDGYVAGYSNQILGAVWRGHNETPNAKEIRDTAARRGIEPWVADRTHAERG